MKIWAQDDEYETKSVGHIIKSYLKLLKVSWKGFWNSKDIPIVVIRYLFLFSIKDYKDKKITLDDFSTIAGDLYWENTKDWNPNEFYAMDRELAGLLDQTSELAFNNWQKNQEYVISTNEKLSSYYKKFKYLISTYSKS